MLLCSHKCHPTAMIKAEPLDYMAIRPELGNSSNTGLACRRASMPGDTSNSRTGPLGAGNTAVGVAWCRSIMPVRPSGGPWPKSTSWQPFNLQPDNRLNTRPTQEHRSDARGQG